MDVESVVFPKLDDDSVADLSFFDSDSDDVDGEDRREFLGRMEKASMGNVGRPRQDEPEETGLTREKKMAILKKLMKEVNLEDTLNKYRGFPENHNNGNNIRTTGHKVKQNSGKMGSEVLCWADRQYMAKLEDDLEKQYQTDMDKKEEERAELERQRVRRLMVEGIIGPEDMSEGYSRGKDSHLPHHSSNPSTTSSNNHTIHSSRPRKGTASSEKRVRSPRRSAWRSQSAPERKTRYQSTPQPSSKSPRSSNEKGGQNSGGRKSGKGDHPRDTPTTPRYYTESTFSVDTQISRQIRNEHQNQDDNASNTSQRCYVHGQEGCTCDSRKPTKRQAFTKRYVDPQVIELAEEDTVEGMYSLAERILPDDRPKPHIEDPDEARERRRLAAAEKKRRDLALAGRVPRR